MSSTYERIAALLAAGDVRMLTCDVFDTVVWRPVAKPYHLWVRLADRLIASGLAPADAQPAAIARARVAAERRARELARRAYRSDECTLEEIWAQMPVAWCGTGDRARYVAAELDCERAYLRPYPRAVELLCDAHAHGVRVVLVSDSYLSPAQMADLLGGAGVPMEAVDDIVTSSSRRLGKWRGLLGAVVDESGIEPSAVLHIGDSEEADEAIAQRIGVRAVLLEVPSAGDVTRAARSPLLHYSSVTGTDGGVTAAIRATLLADETATATAAYQFGAAVAGPLLGGFAAWASDLAGDLGVSSLHCLLREGATIAELAAVVRPGGPRTRLVHASRWVTMRAAVIDGTEDELTEALARRREFRAEHVTEAFAIDVERVQRVVGSGVVDHHDRADALAAIAADSELRGEILGASAKLRRRLWRYLESTLDLSADRLVVCDIGWGGTIQEGMTRILRSEGVDLPVTGLYLLLSPAGEERVARGHDMRSYVPVDGPSERSAATAATIARNPEIPERIATPATGTLIDIDDAGRPVCRPDDHDHRPVSLELAQRAIHDFAATLVALGGPPARAPWVDDGDFRAALGETLANALQRPDPRLAAELGEWPHDDVAGTSSQALTAGAIAGALHYLNAADAAEVPMNEVFWMRGLAAAADPVLAAQLAAIDAGIDAELLAPKSPLGVAEVAAFGLGALTAATQRRGVPRLNAAGWALLTLAGSVPSLRVVRVDFGAEPGIVQLGMLSVAGTHPGGTWRVDCAGFDHPALRWVDGRPLGGGLAAFRAGGHLLVTVPAELQPLVQRVEVTAAFRAWPLGASETLLAEEPLAARLRRGAASIARHLPGARRHPRP